MRLNHLAALLAAASIPSLAHAATPYITNVGPATATGTADFEIFLPLQNKPALENLLVAQQTVGSPAYHQWLTPAQFGSQFGPPAKSFANIEAAASAAGLTVTAVHSRSIHVSGTVAQVSAFFATTLNDVAYSDGHHRLQTANPIAMPEALQREGASIVAFTRLPENHINSVQTTAPISPDNDRSAFGPYFADDMKQAYNYPSYATMISGGKRLDGDGVHPAVLMSSKALNSDLHLYFDNTLHGFTRNYTAVTGKPTPTITILEVEGGSGPFGNGAAAEASLDVQQVLGGAPGSKVTLVDIPDLSDAHIADGYLAIVEGNNWDVVNSSFGGCELAYTAPYNEGHDYTSILDNFNEIFQEGNSEGITFVASSGDEAGLECPNVGYFYGQTLGNAFVASVSFPADSPSVTAVGGGNLETTADAPSLESKYVSENALANAEVPYDPYGRGTNVSGGMWGAGGGRSSVFLLPAYQGWTAVNNGGAGRVMPDIGMQVGGCPSGLSVLPCPSHSPGVSFVDTAISGSFYGLIGTSVASPEFVGALALYIEAHGRQGNFNYYLWSKGQSQMNLGGPGAPASAQFFHKGQIGFDGVYTNTSSFGFDFMYGNGSPNVRTLFGMTGYAAAGNPNTSSNP